MGEPGLGRSLHVVAGAALLAGGLIAVLTGSAASTSAAGERRTLKVGLVLLGGSENPDERLALTGLTRAVQRLGVKGRALVADPRHGTFPTLAYLARRRYDLVIGYGTLDANDLAAAARKYHDTRFLALDAPIEELPHRPRNVRGTLFKVEEAAYLAGYLAAAMERRRPGRDAVSSVGGMRVPPVDRFIAGFEAGARAGSAGIATFRAYADNFSARAPCGAIARRQIAQGSGVVFQVAGECGAGALAAARGEGVFGVGVDVDQSALGPHVLTSVLKRFDVALFRAVLDLQRGRFRTGVNAVYGIRSGGVGLGKISPRVPAEVVTLLAPVRHRIAGGAITVPTAISARDR